MAGMKPSCSLKCTSKKTSHAYDWPLAGWIPGLGWVLRSYEMSIILAEPSMKTN